MSLKLDDMFVLEHSNAGVSYTPKMISIRRSLLHDALRSNETRWLQRFFLPRLSWTYRFVLVVFVADSMSPNKKLSKITAKIQIFWIFRANAKWKSQLCKFDYSLKNIRERENNSAENKQRLLCFSSRIFNDARSSLDTSFPSQKNVRNSHAIERHIRLIRLHTREHR